MGFTLSQSSTCTVEHLYTGPDDIRLSAKPKVLDCSEEPSSQAAPCGGNVAVYAQRKGQVLKHISTI